MSENILLIGQVNDILRDAIDVCDPNTCKDVYVITYSDDASLYWQQSGKEGFYDIPESKFGGRSNLGKAYTLVAQLVHKNKLKLNQCAIVLISDGDATDNYKKALLSLDPQHEAYRVALSIDSSGFTTDKHAYDDRLSFKDIEVDDVRYNFIEAIRDYAE